MKFEGICFVYKFEEVKKRIRDTVPCKEATTAYGGI
jgi:hypothetical protein